MQSTSSAVAFGLLLLATACSGSSKAPATSSGPSALADSGSAGTGDAANGTDARSTNEGPTVMLHGSAVSFPGLAPLPDFEVCLREAKTANCQKTDINGAFSLPVPANANVAVSFVRDGFLSILVAIKTGAENVDVSPTAFSAQLTDADRLYAGMGFTRDPTKGLVDVALPGGDLTFVPKSGTGPFVGSTMDVGLTDITGPLAGVPLTVFANIDPGEVEFSATSPSGPCAFSDLLWNGAALGTVKLPIVAGFNTRLISVTCSAAPSVADAGQH